MGMRIVFDDNLRPVIYMWSMWYTSQRYSKLGFKTSIFRKTKGSFQKIHIYLHEVVSNLYFKYEKKIPNHQVRDDHVLEDSKYSRCGICLYIGVLMPCMTSKFTTLYHWIFQYHVFYFIGNYKYHLFPTITYFTNIIYQHIFNFDHYTKCEFTIEYFYFIYVFSTEYNLTSIQIFILFTDNIIQLLI